MVRAPTRDRACPGRRWSTALRHLAALLGSQRGPSAAGLVAILSAYGLVLFPLLLTSLALPFAWWDSLTFPTVVWNGRAPETLRELPGIYHYTLLLGQAHFRPNCFALVALSYVLFGGEFWLWYIVRWGLSVLTAFLVWKTASRLGIDQWSRLGAIAFLIFHPCRPELMVLSADGWAAFGICALGLVMVLATVRDGKLLDIGGVRWPWYVSMVVLFWFCTWLKESNVAFALIVLACYHIRAGRGGRSHLLLAPFWAVVGFTCWRLLTIQRVGIYATVNTSGDILPKLVAALGFGGALGRWAPAYGVIVAWAAIAAGIVLYLRHRGWGPRAAILSFFAAALALAAFLAFASLPVAPRYTVPIAALVALPLAAALASLPRRLWLVRVAFALLFPALMLTDIYGQYVAYQQRFYEQADILALLEDRVAAGDALAVTGSDELQPGHGGTRELQGAITDYFGRYRTRFYRQRATPVSVVPLATAGVPPSRFALVSTLSPARVLAGEVPGLSPERVATAYSVGRDDLGFIAGVYRRLTRRDRVLHISHPPTYDVGAPMLDDPLTWYVYEVAPHGPASRGDYPSLAYRWRDLAEEHEGGGVFRRGEVQEFRVGPSGVLDLRVSVLGQKRPQAPRSWTGQIRVEEGALVIGVADDAPGTSVLTQTTYPADGRWREFACALPPTFVPVPGHSYSLFFFVSPGLSSGRGCTFTVRHLRPGETRVITLSPRRRWGSFSR